MQRTLSFFTLMLQKDFSGFCNQQMQEVGLTKGLLYFILYIGKHAECSTGELIKTLHMDWGHAQRSIEKLTQDGFIKKEKDKCDNRVYRLTLTPKGEKAFEVSHQLFFDWDLTILNELSTLEKEQLMNIMEKLVQHKGSEYYVRNN